MRYIIIASVCLLYLSCNPVKRALKQKEQIDAAIAAWVLDNPMPLDTLIVPGDTVITYDTVQTFTWTYDTIVIMDTVRVIKTKFRDVIKEIRIMDTVKLTFQDMKLVNTLQRDNDVMKGQMQEMRRESKTKIWWLSGLAAALGITAGMMLKRGFR